MNWETLLNEKISFNFKNVLTQQVNRSSGYSSSICVSYLQKPEGFHNKKSLPTIIPLITSSENHYEVNVSFKNENLLIENILTYVSQVALLNI